MRIRTGHVVFVLIIAVLLNVAVAWLCGYYTWPGYQGTVLLSADEFDRGAELLTERDHQLAVTVWIALGVTELNCFGPWYIWEPKDILESEPTPAETAAQLNSIMAENVPNHDPSEQYGLQNLLGEIMYRESKFHTRIDAGWPMRSLRGFLSSGRLDPNDSQTVFLQQERSVIVRDRPLGKGTLPRYLPYGPMWFGLIVNTILYAAVMIAITRMLSAARSKMRLRHNLCPNCKYPIGVSEVCTECGVELAEWAILRAQARRPEAAR